ncbi:MAG: hypothetical protein IPF92_24720 [Myxococcales bacterium]|nr:hypothetical protein [Myxococcales bacterium]
MSATRSTRGPPQPADPAPERQSVDPLDGVDVPAAVLCARCGLSECGGSCLDPRASGVFARVAWEHAEWPWHRRLFATARASTLDCEVLFASLPDGPVGPALTFALTAELFAALGLLGVLGVPLCALFPDVARACLFDPALRGPVLRALAVGVPGLAVLLSLAHVLHGLSIDLGGRRDTALDPASRPSRTLALRFGLYAAGWDLMIGPVGAVLLALTVGPRAMIRGLATVSGLPTRATLAFLKGAYHLEGEPARRALLVSYWGAGIATVLAAAAVVGAVVAALTV